MSEPLIIIPARMGSSRLPGKPLADIAGVPMIVRVWRAACAAGIGRVAVATDSALIGDAVTAAGGEAVMTSPDHQSGSDRVHEAAALLDPSGSSDIIINLQGDLPTLNPSLIAAVLLPLENAQTDIATLAAPLADPGEMDDPHVVKAVGTPLGAGTILRALRFTRAAAPHGRASHYHHIGIYAFRREVLSRFVALPPSLLEKRERLEQLRAMEAGMRIDIALVDTVPVGVDTPADLERARALIAGR